MRYTNVRIKSERGAELKFKLDAFEKRFILDDVFYSRHYFPRITTKQDFVVKEKDTIIDIGANVGVFSVYAASLAKKGKVYAFEPVGENFTRLEQHKAINRSLNLTVINKGVSDKRKKVKIYLCEKNSGGHSLNKKKFRDLHEVIRGSEIVECITLKNIFDSYKIRRCDFLKLDCEGEEARILHALPSMYFKRIDKIALEFHRPVVDEIKLAGFLSKQGFRVTVSNFGRTLGMIFASRMVARKKMKHM